MPYFDCASRSNSRSARTSWRMELRMRFPSSSAMGGASYSAHMPIINAPLAGDAPPPMRILAGDVGGTKTLLRCVEADGTTSAEERFDSGTHATFDDLLRAFLPRVPGGIDAACFAVAGPVFDNRAEVTNLSWVMDAQELSRAFAIPRVSLINDFSAVALGVPFLREGDLLSIHRGQRETTAPIGI